MQTSQSAFTPRNNAPLFGKTQGARISDTSEMIALLRYFAFSFADTFGAERAVDHIGNLFDRLLPLIHLTGPEGVDEDTHIRQIRGIQEIMICVRGRHNAQTKLGYITGFLDDPCWDLGGAGSVNLA